MNLVVGHSEEEIQVVKRCRVLFLEATKQALLDRSLLHSSTFQCFPQLFDGASAHEVLIDRLFKVLRRHLVARLYGYLPFVARSF